MEDPNIIYLQSINYQMVYNFINGDWWNNQFNEAVSKFDKKIQLLYNNGFEPYGDLNFKYISNSHQFMLSQIMIKGKNNDQIEYQTFYSLFSHHRNYHFADFCNAIQQQTNTSDWALSGKPIIDYIKEHHIYVCIQPMIRKTKKQEKPQ